jgi:HK97 family phage major capsid protein
MGFNNVIDRSGAQALMPEEVSTAVLDRVPEMSAVMRLARRLPNMSRAQVRMPVLGSLPTAYFVTADGGMKQPTEVDWANKYIDAEELAVIVPIPKSVLDDTGYDIWGNVKPLLEEALGLAVDRAVLYGTNIPATWTTNLGGAGLVARATAASHTVSLANYTDLYEALLGETAAGADGVLMLLEADGFIATGHIAHTSLKGKLRNTRDANGQPIFKSGPNFENTFATGELDGAPILYPLNGAVDASQSLDIAGAWNQLLYAMRTDIYYEISNQAVIQDAAGNIVYNLFQQNMIALKVTMRLGFALPNPIKAINTNDTTRCPFAVLTA